jgi:hypothetical protein
MRKICKQVGVMVYRNNGAQKIKEIKAEQRNLSDGKQGETVMRKNTEYHKKVNEKAENLL